jgi:hypothetical protein
MPVIPATQKVVIGRFAVQGKPGQKERPQYNKPGIVVYTCDSSYVGNICRMIMFKASSRQKCETLSKK